MEKEKVLEVNNLKMYYRLEKGDVKAVDDVSFYLYKGETLGLVGESGCGKTTTGFSLLGMPTAPGEIVGGEIKIDGQNIVGLSETELRKTVRWSKISMVFQGAMGSMTPVFTIEKQMMETLMLHKPMGKPEALALMEKYLGYVGLPAEMLKRYPHELSGGQKQRVAIAMALFLEPEVIICDEPTTALDVVVQAQIINVLKDLKEKLGLSFIFITHDLAVESEVADRVCVMYAGQIAEIGTNEQMFGDKALHPYTQRLLAATPRLRAKVDKLETIPGTPPDLLHPPVGCRFEPRCLVALDRCKTEVPPMIEVDKEHFVACWRCVK